MASGFGSVGSVLTERPPSDELLVTPVTRGTVPSPPSPVPQRPTPAHPSPGHNRVHQAPPPHHTPAAQRALLAPHEPLAQHEPLTQESAPPGQERGSSAGNRAWYDSLLSGREYDVVYDDAEGYPLLAFADGQWYDVTSFNPRPVSVRYAIHLDPAWAGAVVQTVCGWMRGNPGHDRSFELATELALAVGELARLAAS